MLYFQAIFVSCTVKTQSSAAGSSKHCRASSTWLWLLYCCIVQGMCFGSRRRGGGCASLMNPQSHLTTWKQTPACNNDNMYHFHSICFDNWLDGIPVENIFWLLSAQMVLFYLDGNPGKERTTFTGGHGSLATLTAATMAVMQLTRLLWVTAEGDSGSLQQP